jgi:hypothetical protein
MRSRLAAAIEALVDQPVVRPAAITAVNAGGQATVALGEESGRVIGSASDAPIRTSGNALAIRAEAKGTYVLIAW